MKIFLDTNVLISAALNPESVSFKAFQKAVTYPNKAIICEQNIEELQRIFEKKFSNKKQLLDRFLVVALLVIEKVPTPRKELQSEQAIRDHADRPILRAAIQADSDIILTGDKDFLESGIKKPYIMTPGEFVSKILI